LNRIADNVYTYLLLTVGSFMRTTTRIGNAQGSVEHRRGIEARRPLLVSAVLIWAIAPGRAAEISSGSGIVIGTGGEVLTNSHVVEDCKAIAVRLPLQKAEAAAVIARDQKNDLAVVRVKTSSAVVAVFREGASVRAGDPVVALGYPLAGLLASAANVSVGNVSALAGIGDDTRYLQISAPVQPGNSGGPLLDAGGRVVAIVTSKLNAARVARFTGDIPQNVNFALKAEVARTFLDSNGISYQTARVERQLSAADVGDVARPFTAQVQCVREGARPAAAAVRPSPQEPAKLSPSWNSCLGREGPRYEQILSCTAVIRAGTDNPNDLSIAFANRANAYRARGDNENAIADFSEAIRLNPRYALARTGRGLAYNDTRQYDRAIADYSEAIEINPADAIAYYGRCKAYRAKGDNARATLDCDEANRLDPKLRARY